MPSKRKLSEVDTALPAVPPSLPPSVEEAYRRKCVQLKSRTSDVEEANDASRLRLARIRRQVEKLRIERAFLLEQLAKRTSTNVEDSDGSPSPPPTEHQVNIISNPDANRRKPKDKPLRIKRGHRKTDQEAKDTPSASFAQPGDGSPAPSDQGDSSTKPRSTNGVKKSSKTPARDAFELYCDKERPIVEKKAKDSDVNIDEELERGWKELPDSDKDEYRAKAKEEEEEAKEEASEREAKDATTSPPKESDKPEDDKPESARDEDVEMKNYDTEDQDLQGDKEGED